jgi:DNA repair exonuclease SbcCD nuclease subunit
MRIAHISDTHLGFSELRHVDPETGINVREADAYRAFERALNRILELKPDLLVHSGDLFDRPHPPNRAIVTALKGFSRLAEAGIPSVVVAGNHSQPNLRGTGCILEALEVVPRLAAIFDRPRRVRVGDASVQGVPHGTDEEELRRNVEAAAPDPRAARNILVLHAGLRNGPPREWNEALVPRELVVRQSERFDYVALGHYHRAMKIAPMAWYAGSTERFHPSESGYDKGFLSVDLERREARFEPVPTRPILDLEPLDGTGMNPARIAQLVSDRIRPLPAGAIARLTLVGAEPDPALLRKFSGHLLELQISLRRRRGTSPRPGAWSPEPLPRRFGSFLMERVSDDRRREGLWALAQSYFDRAGKEDDPP